MAAFDLRHLSAPITSKLNLITIIFIVVLFSVYRLSLGNVQREPVPTRKVANVEPPAPPIQKPFEPKKLPAQANDPEKFLNDILSAPSSKPKPVAEPAAAEPAPLADIEKALGIESE